MHIRLIPKNIAVRCILLSLGLFLLASCGINTSAGTSSTSLSANAATATACAQATRTASSFKTTSGTLKSISGSTFVLTSVQGSAVTVTYTSTTRFTQQSNVVASSLQSGTPVVVLVTSSGGTYSATSITVSTGTTGAFPRANGTPGSGAPGSGTPGTGRFGGGRGGNNPCFNRGQTGTPRPGTGTGTATSNFRGLIGTVSQVSGNIMTIADSTGTDYIVTITSQTKIQQMKTVTAKALKVGSPLTVTGTAGSQGAIAARTVAILLSLPSRPQTPQ